MGSLQSAQDVYQQVAQNDFIDAQLDLGGKDAMYVDKDADIGEAVNALLRGSFYNAGQSRNSIQRVFAHKSISNDLINAFSKSVNEEFVMGDPADEKTNIGPLALAE